MEPIKPEMKAKMEECKVAARKHGLQFNDDTIEYMVSNNELIQLMSRHMIPTHYDYWVHDVHVLQEEGKYKLQPHNPFEAVINGRPPISFYNASNPDWMMVPLFYHVLGHIDFFQNNAYFKHTWNDDFVGEALSDKRRIAELRRKEGRWVDYVIEFARGIDNLVDYYGLLTEETITDEMRLPPKLDFYFGKFLQDIKNISQPDYSEEVKRYNELQRKFPEEKDAEEFFFFEVKIHHPDFDAQFKKEQEKKRKPTDLTTFLMEESPFLNKRENWWMKEVMQIVRNSSLYFRPQIQTKITNEGWASYWDSIMYFEDDWSLGNEVNAAVTNAWVTSVPPVGLNPYAIGMRLIKYVEELANKGKLSFDFHKIKDFEERKNYDLNTGLGKKIIFKLRREFDDFNLINRFVDKDFVDKYNLFVTGIRINYERGMREYYIKSRKAEDYKQMLIDKLYHPPHIEFEEIREALVLRHLFEGKQLVEEQIENTLIGIEFLWGGPVRLRTTRLVREEEEEKPKEALYWYNVKDKKVKKHRIKNKD